MDLTDTQHAILHFLAERIEAEGMPPTQTEIARAFGFKSLRAAQYHLEALEAAGAIERLPGRARAIRVLQTPETATKTSRRPLTVERRGPICWPVLGNVAAGLPIGSGAAEHGEAERHLLIDASLFRPEPGLPAASARRLDA
jgi:repressor LexA